MPDTYICMVNQKGHSFHKITRPGQYVAFITREVPTLEGPAYIFLGCDGYSEYAFQIGVEPNEDPETVLKCIYLFMENKEFATHMHKGFTLVFDRYEELSERIEAIIKHSNGKVLFNKGLHNRIAQPLLNNLGQRFGRKN